MDKITEVFKDLPEHCKIADYINSERNFNDSPNILLYGHHSFPLQIILYYAFSNNGKDGFRRIQCVYGKDIYYHTTPHFIELDFNNPMLPRDLTEIPTFIMSIIKQNAILGQRHVIILRNVDAIEQKPFCNILEDFKMSAWFICTTHRLNNVSDPVRSRLFHIRAPASPKHFAIKHPDIADILKTKSDIRTKAYKLLQTAAPFSEIAMEYILQKARPTQAFIQSVTDLQHKFASTPGARIPIFIERLLYL